MDYHLHAGMPEEEYGAFIAAVTSEFAEVLAGASEEECFDALIEAYGLEFNPVKLQDTTDAQLDDLREALAENLERDVSLDAIREAVLRCKARWPA